MLLWGMHKGVREEGYDATEEALEFQEWNE